MFSMALMLELSLCRDGLGAIDNITYYCKVTYVVLLRLLFNSICVVMLQTCQYQIGIKIGRLVISNIRELLLIETVQY